MEFEINIPTDTDGFAILQCHLCGEYFKLSSEEINSEENLQIWCPYCGLTCKSYIPEEVINNAMKIAENEAMKMIYDNFKSIEKQFKKSNFCKFKAGKKPEEIFIEPLKVKLDNLEIKKYNCCKKQAKISPLSISSGSYCPFCGGMHE